MAADRYVVREDVGDSGGSRFRVTDVETGDVISGWWSYDRAQSEADNLNQDADDARCEDCGAYYPHHLRRNCKGEHVAPVK